MRIDKLVQIKGLVKSREAAQRIIKAGALSVNGKVVTKPSFDADEDASLEIIGEIMPYVSRGGLKLEKAIDVFSIDVNGLDCVDVGASTGGFTDCLLKHGASRVRAFDVGRAQLDKTLAEDPRVISYEGINARYVTPEDIGGRCELAVCDVSFISLTLILGAVRGLINDGGSFVALIKPQFEAGRENVGKGGIVKDRNVHAEVIKRVIGSAEGFGFACLGLCASPILGGDGNREYLARFCAKDMPSSVTEYEIRKTVFDA